MRDGVNCGLAELVRVCAGRRSGTLSFYSCLSTKRGSVFRIVVFAARCVNSVYALLRP